MTDHVVRGLCSAPCPPLWYCSLENVLPRRCETRPDFCCAFQGAWLLYRSPHSLSRLLPMTLATNFSGRLLVRVCPALRARLITGAACAINLTSIPTWGTNVKCDCLCYQADFIPPGLTGSSIIIRKPPFAV